MDETNEATSTSYDRRTTGALHNRHPQEFFEPEQLALPRADRGFHAWAFLVACFFIEALVWG